ncbi:hypothetical protein ABG067_007789, partial [Albugo candida]
MSSVNSTISPGASGDSRANKRLNWRICQPKDFDGEVKEGVDVGNEAYLWLKKMERLKTTTKMSDEEILYVVGDHLVSKAETWYNVVGVKADSWSNFVEVFKKQYLGDQEDQWWSDLQNLKQTKADSIDDIALKMEELFELLGNTSHVFQVRTFLSAIFPEIAFHIEKEGVPESFEEVKSKAKLIEKSIKKYGVSKNSSQGEKFKGPISTGKVVITESIVNRGETVSRGSEEDNQSVMSVLAQKLDLLTINLVKLSEEVSKVKSSNDTKNNGYYNNASNNYGTGGIVCFNCKAPGHKKYDCPEFKERSSPASGSNSVPIGNGAGSSSQGQGKDMGRTQALNLLDTVISDEDSVSEEGVNEILMNGVKRILSVPSVEAQGDAIEPAIRTTKRAKKVIPVVTPVVKLKKKSPRKKARRFPVSFEKSKIWSKLVNTSSDISMAEWLSLDKEAAAEVIDGIRFLRESRIKRKSKAVTEIQNSGNQNLVMNIEVDSNSDSEGSSMISYGDANSEFSGNSSVTSDISSSLGSEITETDLEFSDEESVYRYAYDLKKIKSGSPLRGVISINNVQVEAVFDTGASLSLISEELCSKLGLVTNGDKVQLVGFNSEHGPTSSSMVMDVPIAIVSKNGKLNIRPEHMAVQIGGSGNTCLIGIPWFDNYNVSLDIKKALVCIPTTTGMVKLQCTTTHSTQSINSVGLNESREEKEIYQVGIAQQCTVLPEEELIPMGDEDNKVELEITGDNIADGIVADLADIIQEFKDCFSEVSGLGTIK